MWYFMVLNYCIEHKRYVMIALILRLVFFTPIHFILHYRILFLTNMSPHLYGVLDIFSF